VAHDKDGELVRVVVEVRRDEGGHVGEDALGRARVAAVARVRDRAAPATLVDAVHGDATRGEGGKEAVVAVDVVAEAVDEEEFGFDWGGGVRLVAKLACD